MEGHIYGDGTCAVCGCRCQPGHLMCGPDWAKVPRPLMDAVYVAHDRWYRQGGSLGALRVAQDEAVVAAGGIPGSEL